MGGTDTETFWRAHCLKEYGEEVSEPVPDFFEVPRESEWHSIPPASSWKALFITKEAQSLADRQTGGERVCELKKKRETRDHVAAIPGFLDSRIPGFPDSWFPGFPDSWIPGFLDSWIPRFLDSWIPGEGCYDSCTIVNWEREKHAVADAVCVAVQAPMRTSYHSWRCAGSLYMTTE